MTTTVRAVLASLALAASITAFLVLRPGDDPSPTASSGKGADHRGHATGHAPGGGRASSSGGAQATGAPSVVIRTAASRPVGGMAVLRAKKGDRIRFDVASDTADDVHVHGYDVSAAAAPGRRARIGFVADVEGVFEVELERAESPIARLVVEPR